MTAVYNENDQQMDLFAVLRPRCADCRHMDPAAINPGIHYCGKLLLWTGAEDRPECNDWRERP